MQQQAGLAAALQRLRALGFKPVRTRPRVRAFDGALRCKRGDVPVRFEISDWDFVEYPIIKVRERPSFFPPLMPHISADGTVCYLADGAAILDRFRPDLAVWQCIDQARAMIDTAIEDPQYRTEEFRGEFSANWHIAQLPHALPGLIGTISAKTKVAHYYVVGPNDALRLYVSDNTEEVSQFCHSLGWSAPDKGIPVWIFRSARVPAMPASGLPATIHSAFDWLKAWDPELYMSMQTVLGMREYLTVPRCEFVIATPVGWIGFGFDLHPINAKAFARKPHEYRNYLHRRGGGTAIYRRVYQDVSPGYAYGRSVTNLHTTLSGKKIALVGCGAIGGYLAPALVRLGGGTDGGVLHLMDVDMLLPDNLGRHRLGYDSLFDNKATALKKTLSRESPFSNITTAEKSALTAFPEGFDLVIDATGDQAVAEALNAHHVQTPMRQPMLHVWVYGNGECVQGVWVDSRKCACYRCLRHHDEAQYQKERFPLSDASVLRAFVGCHAFTPYAVSAPMSAAALATDFITDWLKGDPSPRFRLRYNEDTSLRRFKNQNVSPLEGCPACRPK